MFIEWSNEFRFIPLVGEKFDFQVDIDRKGEGNIEDVETIVKTFNSVAEALDQVDKWKRQILDAQAQYSSGGKDE